MAASKATNSSTTQGSNHGNNNNGYNYQNGNHKPRRRKPRGFFGSLIYAIKTIYSTTRSFIIVGRLKGKRIILTDHAKERMDQRHITIDEIREALRKGTLNDRKSEPKEKKWVVDAHVKNKHPENNNGSKKEIEIVLAAHKDETVVITVIDKDTDWVTPDGH